MDYQVRKAEAQDFPRVQAIYASAREFMARAGNPSQWGDQYPEEKILREDIQNGKLYLLCEGGIIHGAFAFLIFADPTYAYIEGAWHSEEPYGVIHRVAGDGSGGILRGAVAYAEKRANYLRIDTHRDNLPMQRAILRLGFRPCGIIYARGGSPRLAYDRVPDTGKEELN